MSLAKNILSKQTIGLIVDKALTHRDLKEQQIERLAISSSQFKLDAVASVKSMQETFENSNIVEILDEKLINKPNVLTQKNLLVCRERLKANL